MSHTAWAGFYLISVVGAHHVIRLSLVNKRDGLGNTSDGRLLCGTGGVFLQTLQNGKAVS